MGLDTPKIARSPSAYKMEKSKGDNMAIDPICKMTVDEKTAKWTSEYKGTTYYFCKQGCKERFDTNPERFIK